MNLYGFAGSFVNKERFHCRFITSSLSSGSAAVGYKEKNRSVGLTDYFGQFLSLQWNTGKFSADSAESSTQDPLGFFAVGRVFWVSTGKR